MNVRAHVRGIERSGLDAGQGSRVSLPILGTAEILQAAAAAVTAVRRPILQPWGCLEWN